MGMFANFRIRKAINTLLSRSDQNDPEVAQAVAMLKAMGSTAIPKLIAVLDQSDPPALVKGQLIALLRDETLPLYVKELATTNHRIVAGVTDILSTAHTYNPCKLIEYVAQPKFSKAALTQILTCHKAKLDARAIAEILNLMDKDSRTVILRLVDEVATESMIPTLLPLIQTEDWITRLSIVRTLGRFHMPQVQATLLQLLADPHKSIRQVAIEGLGSTKNPDHLGPLCQLLRDPDLMVQGKAIEAIIQMNHPQTVHYLLDLLQDESEYVRRGAVEILNAVGNTSAVKDLLGALRDKDWWVRVRAADALGTIGGPTVVGAVLELFRDEDEFIRRCAIEILNTTKDERAFTFLLDALNDKDWWVRERAVDALAKLGNPRAVPALLPWLGKDAETSRVVLRALATLGDPQAILPILSLLQDTDRSVVKEALQALSTLTDEQHAAAVQQALLDMLSTPDAILKEWVQSLLKALIETFGDRVGTSRTASSATTPAVLQAEPPPVGMESLLAPSRAQADLTPAKASTGGTDAAPYIDIEALEPDDVLADRYRVIRRVGKGAFGIVLLVEDTVVREEIILKFLNPQLGVTEQMTKRFIHELRYARRITHENVIRIYDFLIMGKVYAISMEYFPSHPLSAYIKRGIRSKPKHCLKIVQDVCSGMSVAHQAQVVHRDLKPPNILLNNKGVLKIVDFGLAAAANHDASRVTKTGFMVGTPTYMSPEQIRGEDIDARTDIYSLGVIMYELFTGKPPYTGKDPVSIIYQHVQGKAVPPRQINPGIDPQLEAIILKAMAVAPQKRFQSMDALREALTGLGGA
jgi:serine/threonine-protein kinase